MARVYRIEDYRTRRMEGAPRERVAEAHAVFAKELAEVRRKTPKPAVLCLQNLEGGVPASDGGWDLIYSAELLGGLPSVAAYQVVKTAMNRLKAGGRMLLANPVAGPNGRDEQAMAELAGGLPRALVGGQAVFRDASGSSVFLELHKVCAGPERATLPGPNSARCPAC